MNFVDPDGLGIVGALLGGLEGGAVGYAEEGAVQVLDKDFTGLDCGKLRSAAGWGAAFGAAAGASKSTGQQCFAAGTSVATARGSRAIEDVAVGDRVLSRGEDGAFSYAPVTRLPGRRRSSRRPSIPSGWHRANGSLPGVSTSATTSRPPRASWRR